MAASPFPVVKPNPAFVSPLMMRPGTAPNANGEQLIISGLPAGPHKVLIELVNSNHQTP